MCVMAHVTAGVSFPEGSIDSSLELVFGWEVRPLTSCFLHEQDVEVKVHYGLEQGLIARGSCIVLEVG